MKSTLVVEDIITSIELAYDSLKSHLDGCITVSDVPKICVEKGYGTVDHHRKCVQEYAFIIYTLSRCLNERGTRRKTKGLHKG